ncbi:hypothetical protein PM082_012376 [Marasmius tenuissimus]|nr:hypothetical protein PM082_012376 [Marasmius tenuissimus]
MPYPELFIDDYFSSRFIITVMDTSPLDFSPFHLRATCYDPPDATAFDAFFPLINMSLASVARFEKESSSIVTTSPVNWVRVYLRLFRAS